MKSGGGSASAPSASGGGGKSLVIAERQKPAPSCVAALFQMFAKRKLFSSSSKKAKLIPPVRAQKFSPGRQPVGGEKTPAAKMRPLLIDSADCSRSKVEGNVTGRNPQAGQDRNCSENEMCAPGVVARLMGLSSMPAVNHQRPNKATDSSELGDYRNSGPQDWSGTSRSIYTSPQKQQKTGQRTDDRRRDSASQFNVSDTRPLWPRRYAHKVASPVKSPRSMSSRNKARLIEAAAKVLEPGLQSKNRRLSWRHAYLEYPCSSDDGAPGATAVLHNVSDQFLRDICNVDAPRLDAHNMTSTTEDDTSKKRVPIRRSDQDVSCQMQTECFLFSSTEKIGFGDNVQRTSNLIADTNQGARKKQLRSNISRDSAPCGPLKQNNLKQNALPAACRAADPGYMAQTQSNKHRSGERDMTNGGQDFVYVNKRMNGSTPLRSKRKVIDRFGEPHANEENKNMSTKGHRASNLHGESSNKLKLKTTTPKAMEKDMIIAKGAGLVSEKSKPTSPNCGRSDYQREPVSRNGSRGNKESGTISFTSSSPMKVGPTLRGDNATGTGTAVQGSRAHTFPKRHPHRDGRKTSPEREAAFREDLQDTSSLETTESVLHNQDEVKNRVIPGGRAASSSLFENKSVCPITEESLSNEQLRQRNSVDCVIYGNRDPHKPVLLYETRKKHEADTKGSKPSPSISRCSNKWRPTSILQSTDTDGAFIPSIPLNTADATSTDSHPTPRETCTVAASMQDAITKRNSRCGDPNSGQHSVQPFKPEVQDHMLKHPGEVTTTVELLLTNVRSSSRHKSSEPSKTFLLRTIEFALATLTTGSKQDLNTIKAKEASSLRNLALDFVWDCLDSMCSQLCDSGYRSFSKVGLVCTKERLAAEIRKEIARCGDMAGKGLDELAVCEVERTVEAGMGSMLEAFRIGAQIKQDLILELVNEIGVDMFERS